MMAEFHQIGMVSANGLLKFGGIGSLKKMAESTSITGPVRQLQTELLELMD